VISASRVPFSSAWGAWWHHRHPGVTPPTPSEPVEPVIPGGTPPLPLEVRLDAVAAVLLDGLSYRRAGRMVGISKTEVGDSMDLLVGKLAALGYCQPDGTFVVTFQDLRERLGEMAEIGEAACVDGLAMLYVEDNLSNLQLVERVLGRRPGVKLISAMRPQLGLDLACEHHPAIADERQPARTPAPGSG
jgi:hypothetical protein